MKATLVLGLVILAGKMEGYSQGTVQFVNSALSRVQSQMQPGAPINTAGTFYIGLFWSTNPICNVPPFCSWNSELAQPVVVMTNGLFNGGISYPIPGTEPGQTVYMQLAAWDLAAGARPPKIPGMWGEAGFLPITLGPKEGPGAIIYQGRFGTNAYRFKPFLISSEIWPPPNRPTWHFSSAVGARSPGHGGEIIFQMIRYDPYFRYPEESLAFGTTNGTALAGRDYATTNGTVFFPAGKMSQPVRIQLLPSDGTLGDRQFQIWPWQSSYPPVPAFSGTGTITDLGITAIKPGLAGTAIDFVTVPGRKYSIQSSEDLITWSAVPGLGQIQGSGALSVVDPRPDCCGLRFYRVSNP